MFLCVDFARQLDFSSEIPLIHLADFQQKVFPVGLKQETNCCRLPFKAPEEDKEEVQEVAASLANAIEISVDSALVASELDD